jgi:uncharacterized membrane protein
VDLPWPVFTVSWRLEDGTVILIEVVAGILLALGSVLIIRALIVTDTQEAVAAGSQERRAPYRRAA